jgi:hypothetical protein
MRGRVLLLKEAFMARKTADGGHFDVQKMAEIIFTLKKTYGDDALVRGMINHLIRDESDFLVPPRKSAGAARLEEKFGLRLAKLPRNKVWTKDHRMSSHIIVEHGLPIAQALDICMTVKSQGEIEAILGELQESLVYITKDEHAKLDDKGFAKKRKKDAQGNWFGDAYEKCGIALTDNR